MIFKHKNRNFSKIERNLKKSLFEIKENIKDQDYIDIDEYISHGEYGLAFDLMISVIQLNKLDIPKELIESKRLMKI